MFLRVARSVVRQTEKKLEEAIGHEETQKAVHQQLAGMKKMLLTLESFQDLLVTQGGRERGLDLSQGIDSIVGRLVLLQYVRQGLGHAG